MIVNIRLNPSRDKSFEWYVGSTLASSLPYRKKRILLGPKVCRWHVVMPLAKAAFFIGCCLGLSDKSAAEEILTDMATNPKGYGLKMKPQPWRPAFREITRLLEWREQHIDVDMATYESFFPEDRSNILKHVLLTPEGCTNSIGSRVCLGLIFGVLFPERALSMLEAWLSQDGGWKDLRVSALPVHGSPLVTSVEEAYEHAQSIYHAWRQSL